MSRAGAALSSGGWQGPHFQGIQSAYGRSLALSATLLAAAVPDATAASASLVPSAIAPELDDAAAAHPAVPAPASVSGTSRAGSPDAEAEADSHTLAIADARAHAAEHAGGQHSHHRFHLGGSAVALASFTGGAAPEAGFGGEAFFEVIVEPQWLEIELNIGGLSAENGFLLAIDLVYKKPFHLNSWLHPFIGLGPTFVPAFLPQQIGFSYGVGGTLVAGTHLWLSSSFGVVLEIKYNLLYQSRDTQSGMAQELGGGAGLIVAL